MTAKMHDFEARASIVIAARPGEVWDALTDPAEIKEYMFGTTVEADWTEGGPISWRGEWQGTAYQDRGTVLRVEPARLLQYTHISSLSGAPGEQHEHIVTLTLTQDPHGTEVLLTQSGNPSESARRRAQANWRSVLEALKDHIERRMEEVAREKAA